MKKIVPHNAKLVPSHAKRVFQGVMFNVYQWDQEMFDGTTETFEMIGRADIVEILAVVDGKIVVLSEEQPMIGKFMDIPGGRHDHPEDTHLDAAKREMLEETGMSFKNWRLVQVSQLHSKNQCFIYFFVATDLIDTVQPKLDAGEKIDVNLLSFDEYRKLRDEGKLRAWPAILDKINSVEEILELPEFEGKEVEVVE